MVVGSVHIISRLDGQSKFQMFTRFFGRHVGGAQSSTNMAALYWAKLAQNISTNIDKTFRRLGKRRDLELGEVSSLPISYNITIS